MLETKKKILFVIDSLAIGGSERSLVSLLSTIDSHKYDIDLQMFKYGGELEELLPPYVNILSPLQYSEFCCKPFGKAIKKSKVSFLLSRLLFSIVVRLSKPNSPISYAITNWKIVRRCFDKVSKEYDVAVAYAQNTPTFYVAECVNAKKKLAWVNELYRPKEDQALFLKSVYAQFANICCVSDSCLKQFTDIFPDLASKTTLMMDIINAPILLQLSKKDSTAKKDMLYSGIKILTVGRLVVEKGYDIVVDACKRLNDRGLNFKWFVIGDGSCKQIIEGLIQENNLKDKLILLGSQSNPYPYYLEADIYVQTSRLEGFGLTVSEAKVFDLPIVSTNFSAVYSQISHLSNGYISEMSGSSVAEGIVELINNTTLRNEIVKRLKTEKKDNKEEINVLYDLIEE